MKIAVYRKDGLIYYTHEVDEKKDVTQGVIDYNEKYSHENRTIEICKFADDSYVAYLIKDKALRKKEFKDDLSRICYDIESLYDQISWLRDEIKEMEREE